MAEWGSEPQSLDLASCPNRGTAFLPQPTLQIRSAHPAQSGLSRPPPDSLAGDTGHSSGAALVGIAPTLQRAWILLEKGQGQSLASLRLVGAIGKI